MLLTRRTLIILAVCTVVSTIYSLSELRALQLAGQGDGGGAHGKANGGLSGRATSREVHAEGQGAKHVLRLREPAQATQRAASPSQASGPEELPSVSAHSTRKCYMYPHTEMWGDVVGGIWGPSNKKDTAAECCEACRNMMFPDDQDKPSCNVWVYCGDPVKCGKKHKECWLKHLAHPAASKPMSHGPQVPWTSGTIDVDLNYDPRKAQGQVNSEDRRYHIVTTAQGGSVHWQIRIHYYWYKKHKAACEKEGHCEMGGFTRLLHSGKPDNLMDEIPTVVVDPLPKDKVKDNWYVVLNRPYAMVQWVDRVKIPERYILMMEPDHLLLRPLPNFMVGETPASFPFFYIEPAKAEYAKITKKFTGPATHRQLEEIAPIGNSPTFMSIADARKALPLWMNTSIAIFKDPDAAKAWGWVQEMYGFAIGSWLANIKRFDLHLPLMAQPPWDTNMEEAPGKPFYILHYTYGMDYTLEGKFTPGKIGAWRFDKRSHGSRPIPRNMAPPPDGIDNDLVRHMINAFNEATDAIPCWPQYANSGGADTSQTCGEAPKHFLLEEAEAKKAQQQQLHDAGGAAGGGGAERGVQASRRKKATRRSANKRS